ncbi:uncharacterized protein LOC134181229 isoform X2 [Corticium candelabrum]|uniref:uncharacterized protein LOC134181229 isoform X2 n=1 Tax=Corticium candelabrum TaxID=121492 RepID=UPI002E252E46|nr:uncharacterized protein LOC134181229 isoform X2 [Corticium candelabrum]
MSQPDKEVFLSYGREPEVTNFARKLRDDLESMGFTIWFDQTDIPAGSDWHGAIGTGLDRCKALIAIITHKYVGSRFCTSELYTASSDGKFVFPVFYEHPDLSASEKARGVKYVISGINWTMFRPGMDVYDQSLQKLADGMFAKGLGSCQAQDFTPTGERRTSSSSQHALPAVSHSELPPPYSCIDLNQQLLYNHSCGDQQLPFGCGMSSTSSQHFPVLGPGGYPTSMQMPLPDLYTNVAPEMYPSAPPVVSSLPLMTGCHLTSHQEDTFYEQVSKLDLFKDTDLEPQANSFKVGMKLEARDRKNPSMVCVATVTRVQDKCLLIHFDGWTEKYDYWCEHTSQDIHPIGWCKRHTYNLQSPKNMPSSVFDWASYLRDCKAHAASETLFVQEQLEIGPPAALSTNNTTDQCKFSPGMRLEATDRKYPTLICAATIAAVKDHQLLIHFDGWSGDYDYWCDCKSTDIHPIDYCKRTGHKLQAPKDIDFDGWPKYLKSVRAIAAPESIFEPDQCIPSKEVSKESHQPQQFVKGMKLEAVDRKHPSLVCVATIANVEGSKVLIHFDGWTNKYDYWCDDVSGDLRSVGWCKRNHVPLQAPKGMRTFIWRDYLKMTESVAAPEHLFHKKS